MVIDPETVEKCVRMFLSYFKVPSILLFGILYIKKLIKLIKYNYNSEYRAIQEYTHRHLT